MNNNIVIGKHTLESLTSGMYSDPYVVFREYIQNAADSIDDAYKAQVLSQGNDRINICISPIERQIIIEDNGIGIPAAKAEKTLVSIGNSQKASDNSRGFRGIGRLSALSYCSKLTFETSFSGEEVASKVIIDATKLAELLAFNADMDVSVVDVLDKVYTAEIIPVSADSHYFKVTMEGIDDSSKLTEYDEVLLYLSQNVPVPYDPKFTWGKEIIKRLKAEGYYEPNYNVYLTYGDKTIPVFKPYRDEFLVDKSKNLIDKILDINVVKLTDSSNNPIAIGWLAKTNYLGSIYDRSVKGIRLRKGNILIGDHQTLNVVFKDARFNGWSIGEIFAMDLRLIPNARRDNFEKNPSYFLLVEQLTTIASTITKDIRSASLSRNTDLSNALAQCEKIQHDAVAALEKGISSSEKGILNHALISAQETIANSNTNNETEDICKNIAFDELDMLIGKIRGATSYRALNILNDISSNERKWLEKIFDAIVRIAPEDAERIIEEILKDFYR